MDAIMVIERVHLNLADMSLEESHLGWMSIYTGFQLFRPWADFRPSRG